MATFIGKMNQLAGVVLCAREGRVRWGDLSLTVPPTSTARLADGQGVVVLVRPESVVVVPAAAEGPAERADENRVPATVEIVTFLGSVTRLGFVAGGGRLLADVTTDDRRRFQRGVPVQLVFPTAACRVLADESTGGSR